ncbi:serine hydrolase [Altererythrobacter aestuarii]|uniref:Serine hydrolase n=2 Tax=Alteraurantiacibacter aestuarii TaxID=650004 RepID=A0A844ZL57_9SPHN|nr:serine hydrolase [Alteraurantiacibacter aestuarii]
MDGRGGPKGWHTRRAMLRRTAGAGLALTALPLAGCTSAAGSAPMSADDWPYLSAMVARYRSRGMIANMLAMIGKGEESLLIGGGTDRLGGQRQSDADSIYRLYSMTKPIVGMAAMLLVEEGRLSLDQPLAEILPAFANMQVQKEYDGPITADNLEPAARPITIRHLLTHTSGLGYSFVEQGPLSQAMKAAGVVTGLVGPYPPAELARGTPVTSLTEFADRLATFPLTHQPGTQWSYSTGLDVIGRVIEVVSGQDFESFLADKIFAPCGMNSTFFRVPEDARSRLTESYDVRGESPVLLDPAQGTVFAGDDYFPMGGTGLVSSPHDYDRFLHMVANLGELDGTRILPAAAVQLGTSDLRPDPSVSLGSWVEGFAFGAAGRLGWAGMDSAYGWAGSAGTVGFVDMVSGRRCAIYTQYMPASTWPIAADFEEAIAADLSLQAG